MASLPPVSRPESEDDVIEIIDCTLPRPKSESSLPPSRSNSQVAPRGLKRCASVLDIPIEVFSLAKATATQPRPSEITSASSTTSTSTSTSTVLLTTISRTIDNKFPLTEADWDLSRDIDEALVEMEKGKRQLEKRTEGRKLRRVWTKLRGGKLWDNSTHSWRAVESDDSEEDPSLDGDEDQEIEIKLESTVIDVDEVVLDAVVDSEGSIAFSWDDKVDVDEEDENEKEEDDEIEEEEEEKDDELDVKQESGMVSEDSTEREQQRSTSPANDSGSTPDATEVHDTSYDPDPNTRPPHAHATISPTTPAPLLSTSAPTLLSACMPPKMPTPTDTVCSHVDAQPNHQLPTPSSSPVKRRSELIVSDDQMQTFRPRLASSLMTAAPLEPWDTGRDELDELDELDRKPDLELL
ncbi:hypothetical protein IAT40_002769 [Kwoniella sp. CBS 6097]